MVMMVLWWQVMVLKTVEPKKVLVGNVKMWWCRRHDGCLVAVIWFLFMLNCHFHPCFCVNFSNLRLCINMSILVILEKLNRVRFLGANGAKTVMLGGELPF